MIDININVNVALQEGTIKFFSSLFNGKASKPASEVKPVERCGMEVKACAPSEVLEQRTTQVVAREEPPEAEQTPVESPKSDAKAKVEEISDEALGGAVLAAKTKTSVKRVREVFAGYGIKCSSECPQEKRPALMEELTKLAQ